MNLKFQVQGRIQKPISEVFDALYNPEKLKDYFVTTHANTPLQAGKTVTWEFEDFPGAFSVIVKEVIKNEKIVIQWPANNPDKNGNPYLTTVEFHFEELSPKNTLVSIYEYNWEDSEQGFEDSRSNSQGWMNMLTCMKAYVEYGINLRKGMFK